MHLSSFSLITDSQIDQAFLLIDQKEESSFFFSPSKKHIKNLELHKPKSERERQRDERKIRE